MKIAYPMRFQREEEGPGWWAQGLAPLEDVMTQGDTLEQTRARAREALSVVLELMLDQGRRVPRPFSMPGMGVELVEPEADVVPRLVKLFAR